MGFLKRQESGCKAANVARTQKRRHWLDSLFRLQSKDMNLRNVLNSLSSSKLEQAIFFSLVFTIPHGIAQTNVMDEAPKDRLVRNIQTWVAEKEGVNVNSIEVQANDRRFIVPACSESFDVSFAFGTRTNVQVSCDSKDWRAVLRIQIKREHEILVFDRALSQGDLVSQDDFRLSLESSLIPGSNLISATEAEGRLLKIDVEEGQAVKPGQFDETSTVFVTNRDIKEGEKLDRAMIDERKVPASETLFEQRFDLALALTATITGDLKSGSVLTKRDFAISSQAIVVIELVERGNMIDDSNSELRQILTQIPSDAIIDRSQAYRASAKRRLNPGEILRFSDIAMTPHVIANTTTTLELNKTNFNLTMEVFAVEDGFIGDRIRVRNQESGEIIYATVKDVGLVELQ